MRRLQPHCVTVLYAKARRSTHQEPSAGAVTCHIARSSPGIRAALVVTLLAPPLILAGSHLAFLVCRRADRG